MSRAIKQYNYMTGDILFGKGNNCEQIFDRSNHPFIIMSVIGTICIQ